MYIGSKEYTWHIPKILRDKDIKVGDIVLAPSAAKKVKIIVCSVFREDIEDTGIKYRTIRKKLWSK